jgi:hypothetical protein
MTRELIHERLECSVAFAQQAAEGTDEMLGRRTAALDQRIEPVEQAGRDRAVLLEGGHEGGDGPVSHVITVAPSPARSIT